MSELGAGERPGRGGGPGVTPGGDGLRADERAELERLRAEVDEAHRQQAAGTRRRIGWRAPVASVLIVLGCVLAPLSVIGVWTADQVSNTSDYVATMSPLISQPAVQQALTSRITNAVTSELDVQQLTKQAADSLSARGATRASALLGGLAGPISNGVNGFVHDQVAAFVASPRAARLWTEANRAAHTQMVKVLSGQHNAALTVTGGQVALNLGPFIDQAKENLAARGLTAASKIPEVNTTYPLFPAKKLEQARSAYRLLNILKIVLPVVALVLLGAGVYLARSRRRALIGAGLGVAASMLVLGAALLIFRGFYLGALPASVSAGAAGAVYDTLTHFAKTDLRVVLVAGLVVAIGAFFAGPSAAAVRGRAAFASALDWVRGQGEHLRTGPTGPWTYAHRRGLRISAVAIAALVFVFWGQPTVVLAFVLAVILLAVLGLIELIGRPPASTAGRRAHA
ncbi:MAG TPA: hypothetical protein VKV80_06475 [Streptosporangiaceae bacterium]|nr:hypothetical protein [Streptosporangiaceae bacterium]